jgi:hypothetical protein
MPRQKIPEDHKRICTTVDPKTHKTLLVLAGRRSIIEGRKVSVAEYSRRILANAVIYDKSALDDIELDNSLSVNAAARLQ